jgi:hypothetical protein
MSQHDMDISNQAFPATRADLNAALVALATCSSGATAPSTTFAYQWWADTTTGILKQRNAANSAWVSVLTISSGKAVSAAAADTATALAAGAAGQIPYQSGSGATAFSAVGTAGQALLSGGSGAPTWGTVSQPQIMPVTASVTSNALTVNLANTSLDFRNSSLTSGAVTTLSTGALSITVPLTSNLGRAVSAQVNRLVALVANSGGTPVLCIVNQSGGVDLTETGFISPTTIGAASNSATVIYSSASVSAGSPYRVVGFVDATFTDGTGWISPITQVQGMGGQALEVMSSLGYGQTWQDVTGSRSAGTNYYNTTGKPIAVSAYCPSSTDAVVYLQMLVNGVQIGRGGYGRSGVGDNGADTVFAIVPPGSVYTVTGSVAVWAELR